MAHLSRHLSHLSRLQHVDHVVVSLVRPGFPYSIQEKDGVSCSFCVDASTANIVLQLKGHTAKASNYH